MAQTGFIGRLEQIRLFEDMVLYEGDKRWILNIYGSGGIGKTALLRYYQIVCDQHGAPYGPLIDFYELAYHSPRRIMRDIARALSSHRPECFAPFLEATAYEPGVLSAEAMGEYLKGAVRLFRSGLIRMAQETLAANRVKTILFFDTCEQAPPSLRAWLLEDLLANLPGVVVVMAGRERLEAPPGREDELYPCGLDAFTLDEAREFFAGSGLAGLDERHVADLWSLARGTPILLSLAADWLAHGVSPDELGQISSDQFARSLVQRFANLSELANAAVLYMGHLHHRFNAEIFSKVHAGAPLDVPTAHKTLEDLEGFQFIKYRPSGNYQLHDHARQLVCNYLLADDEGLALRLRLSRDVLTHYYRQRAATDAVLQAEQLYHELFIDAHYDRYAALFQDGREPQHGYALFEQMFDAAINRNDRLENCDLLLSIVEHPDFDGMFAGRPGTIIKRARLWLRDAIRRDEACELLSGVLTRPDLSPIHRIEALLSLGRFARPADARVYQRQARQEIQQLIESQTVAAARPVAAPTAEAQVAQREHALQLLAHLEINIGLTCRRQGNWAEAIEHYQRALDVLNDLPPSIPKRRLMAATHNNLAFVYRQRGDLHKAEIFCRLSLAAREEAGEPGQLAFSYHTLGEIYMDMGRYAEARRYLDKSLAAFQQVGDMRNAAMVFVDLATLARWRGVPDLADYYHSQAISIFETWQVTEGMIDATNECAAELNRRGDEQADIGAFDVAMDYYRRAESLLRESLEHLQGSDRHHRLAYTASKLCAVLQAQARLASEPDQKEPLYSEILTLADQIASYAASQRDALMTSTAEVIRGQVAFERAGDLRHSNEAEVSLMLEMAFKHFARACATLAEFYQSPSARFRRPFEQVTDCLLHPSLTPSEVDMACTIILRHFEREGQEGAAAAFLDNCRRIQQARGSRAGR